VESTPQTSFRHWELDAVDVVRPDVIGVPLSFLRYPGTGQRLAEAAPPVANIIQRYLDTDSLHPSDLLALAQSRPVFVEMDTHYPPRAYRILTPSKLMYRVLTSPTQIPDAKALEHAQDATFRKLYADVGADLHEVETARQLLWIDYMDALYFSSLGGRDIARKALVRALALHPNDTRLHKLAGALRDPRQIGPLDVTPYLDF
jgi:hypothetical protein